MKKQIKIVLQVLIVLTLVTGAYLGIRYIIKIKNTAVVALNRVNVLTTFITTSFPDQVKAFEEAQKTDKK